MNKLGEREAVPKLLLIAIVLVIGLVAVGLLGGKAILQKLGIIDAVIPNTNEENFTSEEAIRYDPLTDKVQFYDGDNWVEITPSSKVGTRTFNPETLRKEFSTDFYLNESKRQQKKYKIPHAIVRELFAEHPQTFDNFPPIGDVCARGRYFGSKETVLELTALNKECYEKSYGDVQSSSSNSEVLFVPLLTETSGGLNYGSPESVTNPEIISQINSIVAQWYDQVLAQPIKITYNGNQADYYCAVKDDNRYVAIVDLTKPVSPQEKC